MECEIAVRFTGKLACFTDPARKGERATYPCGTPSALVGILESVYWHPGVVYSVREILIEQLGQKFQIATNELEVQSIPAPGCRPTPAARLQRRSDVLQNVSYVVRFLVEDQTGRHSLAYKHHDILLRRLKRKQFYRVPYMGRTQFPTECVEHVENINTVKVLTSKHDRDLGMMLLSRVWKDGQVIDHLFFYAQMRGGRINVPRVADVAAELARARAS